MKSVIAVFRVAHSSRVLVATSRRDELEKGREERPTILMTRPLDSCNRGFGWGIPRRLRGLGMTGITRAGCQSTLRAL
jgi:hypothetical protein